MLELPVIQSQKNKEMLKFLSIRINTAVWGKIMKIFVAWAKR